MGIDRQSHLHNNYLLPHFWLLAHQCFAAFKEFIWSMWRDATRSRDKATLCFPTAWAHILCQEWKSDLCFVCHRICFFFFYLPWLLRWRKFKLFPCHYTSWSIVTGVLQQLINAHHSNLDLKYMLKAHSGIWNHNILASKNYHWTKADHNLRQQKRWLMTKQYRTQALYSTYHVRDVCWYYHKS